MKNRIKNVIILIVEKGMFMASLLRNVETMNIDPRKSNPKAIFKGVNYRITILSERLIRLEYDITGEFNDDLTLLVKNRNFNLPNFKVNQDNIKKAVEQITGKSSSSENTTDATTNETTNSTTDTTTTTTTGE